MINFAILGSSPSLKQAEIDYLKHKAFVIAVNDNYLRCPWADFLYWCDVQWYSWHKDRVEFKAFKGMKITLSNTPADVHYKQGDDVGLNSNLKYLNTGKNSAYQAVNLAKHMRADRIFLLGVDMGAIDNKTHWHNNHKVDTPLNVYDKMLPFWNTIKDDLGDTKIYNCSFKSRIECFEKKDIRKCL